MAYGFVCTNFKLCCRLIEFAIYSYIKYSNKSSLSMRKFTSKFGINLALRISDDGPHTFAAYLSSFSKTSAFFNIESTKQIIVKYIS